MSTENANKPVEKIKVGNVQIAIWKNANDNGVYYTAGAPQLSYNKDGQWHNDGKTYGGRDLVHLAKAALLADSAIVKLKMADKKAGEQAEDGGDEVDNSPSRTISAREFIEHVFNDTKD